MMLKQDRYFVEDCPALRELVDRLGSKKACQLVGVSWNTVKGAVEGRPGGKIRKLWEMAAKGALAEIKEAEQPSNNLPHVAVANEEHGSIRDALRSYFKDKNVLELSEGDLKSLSLTVREVATMKGEAQ